MDNFTIYCNDKYETIIYYNKYNAAINCLLQQHIYHCIKVVIKISSDYCNEIFYCTNLLPQNLLQQFASTIAMISMLLQWFFVVVINIFSL